MLEIKPEQEFVQAAPDNRLVEPRRIRVKRVLGDEYGFPIALVVTLLGSSAKPVEVRLRALKTEALHTSLVNQYGRRRRKGYVRVGMTYPLTVTLYGQEGTVHAARPLVHSLPNVYETACKELGRWAPTSTSPSLIECPKCVEAL